MTGAAATVLAIGAAGKFAGLVVPKLARRGVCVRGFVRNSGQGDAVRAAGAADIAVGDLRDRTSLDAALRGIDAVFYIVPAFMPDEADAGIGVTLHLTASLARLASAVSVVQGSGVWAH